VGSGGRNPAKRAPHGTIPLLDIAIRQLVGAAAMIPLLSGARLMPALQAGMFAVPEDMAAQEAAMAPDAVGAR